MIKYRNLRREEKEQNGNNNHKYAEKKYVPSDEMKELVELSTGKLAWLHKYSKKIRLSEYIDLMQNPGKLFLLNLMAGIGRGVGFAIGFTILSALMLYILNKLAILNIPLLGDFIAEIWRYVEQSKGTKV
ncbi:MAG: DUF5665 domain-containing protein [Bacillota bacterium]|jgi:hypothetical protein